MARSSNSPANDPGHSPLTDEESADLQAYYAVKISAQEAKAAVAKAEAKVETDEVNSLFKRMTADLKYTRKEFEDYLAKRRMTEPEFLNSEAKRAKMYHNGGLPVGSQQTLFAAPQDTVDDKIVARKDGERAGLRADDPKPPSYIAGILTSDWMAGWHDGQTKLAMQLQKADGILAKRGAPNANAEPKDLNAESEDEASDAAVEKAAAKLKRSGFTKRSAPEASAAA